MDVSRFFYHVRRFSESQDMSGSKAFSLDATDLKKIAKGTLIAAGTSICGVTAIVSTAPAIEADEREVAYAVANVVAFAPENWRERNKARGSIGCSMRPSSTSRVR